MSTKGIVHELRTYARQNKKKERKKIDKLRAYATKKINKKYNKKKTT